MAEAPIALSRWIAKKAARRAAATLGGLRRRPGVRALTYHRFGPANRMPFTVTQDAFEREMAFLARTGRAVSLGDLEDHHSGRRALPDGGVLVTIDDGDPSVLRIAAPILQRHGVPAVLYAIAGEAPGFERMSAAELRELAGYGIAIGSHSLTHRSLARLPLAEARTEIADSKARLEEAIGHEVTSLAYPYGTRADVSESVAALLGESGYRTGFTSLHGAVPSGGGGLSPFLLPRVKVESGDPRRLFPCLCDGALDLWHLVDDGLAGLQKPASPSAPAV